MVTCPPPPVPVAAARQAITVSAPSLRATSATVRLWQRDGDCWKAVAGPWTARLGRNGLSTQHREGDGTTPTGTYPLDSTVYGLRPDPGVRYRYHRIACGDWWDGDPASPTYNTFRRLGCREQPPFGGGSEALWKARTSYRYLIPIRYNADPVVPGRGSAIFLHVNGAGATAGCVSLPEAELLQTLRWLRPADRPQIAISAAG